MITKDFNVNLVQDFENENKPVILTAEEKNVNPPPSRTLDGLVRRMDGEEPYFHVAFIFHLVLI